MAMGRARRATGLTRSRRTATTRCRRSLSCTVASRSASTLTYLAQGRAQYRLTSRFDWAGEARFLMQPSSGTSRSVYGTELGFWALPDLRLGVGYNFTLAGEPGNAILTPARRGFYFTISSK